MSVDCRFLGSEGTSDKDNLVLVINHRKSEALLAHPLPSKRVDRPSGYLSLVAALKATRYRRVNLKSDNEPAIKALVTKAVEE